MNDRRAFVDCGVNRAGALLAALALWSVAAVGQEADLVLTNGQIHTADGPVEAMAVRSGVIVALGDAASMSEHTGGGTRTVDLEGAAVLPGLHDMHVHPMGSGLMQSQCQFPQGSSREVVLDTVRRCAEEAEPGEWISGGQWDTASLGGTPHRDMLDQVAPDNPVALIDISVHSLWANSLALELAGITSDTPDPEGGVIERDADGEPTGVLRETAGGLVRGLVPPPSPEQALEGLRWSLELMLSYGITSFTDAGANEGTLQAYAQLADEGSLKQRVRACQSWNAQMGIDMDAYHSRMNRYRRDRLNADCIKVALDGVPTDGHTAAMVEPYAGFHDHAEHATGILMVPTETLNEALITMDAHGFTVKLHAAGDGAVRAGLDAIEAAREANGFTGNLHDLSHNSFVQPDDIARARGLAATFEMSPYIWFPNPIIPDIAAAVGEERMQRFTPVKDALDAGALVVPGSDWAVVPSVNPWIGIETLITRRAPGGDGPALGPGQRISLEQALEMFTRNSARQMGMAHRSGRIARGMLADVVVLDQDPFEVEVTDLHRINTLMTIIGGEIVYTRQ